jgi:hypothetical protein
VIRTVTWVGSGYLHSPLRAHSPPSPPRS